MAHFEQAGELRVRVRASVASMCVFRRMNLIQMPWPFQQRFHIVFLRNVLYYFDPAMRQQVVDACFEATEPGGWLVTSLTEPIIDAPRSWARLGPGIFRKEGGQVAE
jgi:chemotaxis protein methyltransferase CheR